MDQLIHILSALLFLIIVYQIVPHLQAFFIFVMQYENVSMLIFNGMTFAINSLCTILFLNVLAIIINEMRYNIVKINELKYCFANNSQATIGNGRENFQNTKHNSNYDITIISSMRMTSSTPAPSSTLHQQATVFDFDETHAKQPTNDVLKCEFNVNKIKTIFMIVSNRMIKEPVF